jgi:hypothetical protein
VSDVDPDSGELIPDDLTAPFPDPGETALDHVAQAAQRVAIQYARSTHLQAIIAAHAGNAQLIEDCLVSIPPLDDPALATGVNLDVTGDLVGLGRVLSDGTVPNDATYRIYIAMQILRNSSIGSSPQFVAALTAVFGVTPVRYYDLGHMSVGIEVGTGVRPSSDIIALLDDGPMPRAMGVGVSRVWYDATDYFAFEEDVGAGAKGFGEVGDATKGGHFAELF